MRPTQKILIDTLCTRPQRGADIYEADYRAWASEREPGMLRSILAVTLVLLLIGAGESIVNAIAAWVGR